MKAGQLEVVDNRPDHIDYTEHLVRRTVQKYPIRANQLHIDKAQRLHLNDQRDNLNLYLHRRTAELKRQYPQASIGSRPLRNLFLQEKDSNLNRVVPKMLQQSEAQRLQIAQKAHIPTDKMTKRTQSFLADQTPTDYFVCESPCQTKNYANTTRNHIPGAEKLKKAASVEKKLEERLHAQLKDEQLNDCYNHYKLKKSLSTLKLMKFQEERMRDKKFFVFACNSTSNKDGVTGIQRSQSVSCIRRSKNPSTNPQKDFEDDDDDEEEEAELLGDICSKKNITLAKMFEVDEAEFRRKYQNKYLERARKETRKLTRKHKDLVKDQNLQAEVRTSTSLENQYSCRPRKCEVFSRGFNTKAHCRTSSSIVSSAHPKFVNNSSARNLSLREQSWQRPADIVQKIPKSAQITIRARRTRQNSVKLPLDTRDSESFLVKDLSTRAAFTLEDELMRIKTEGDSTCEIIGSPVLTIKPTSNNIIDVETVTNTISRSLTERSPAQSTTFTRSKTLERRPLKSSVCSSQDSPSCDQKNIRCTISNQGMSAFHNLFADVDHQSLEIRKKTLSLRRKINKTDRSTNRAYKNLNKAVQKKIVAPTPQEFLVLQDKTRFRHKLVNYLGDQVLDKKALIQAQERKDKEARVREMHELRTGIKYSRTSL